jgi:chemotaxis protein CheD
MKYTVGVSDMKLSNVPGDIIVTYALGSCLGVAIHDPETGIGGILHYMLPLSNDPKKAEENPLMFGNTGIPLLFEAAYNLGAKKSALRVVIAGGAQLIGNSTDLFVIGKRNEVIARKLFWKNNVIIAAENVGGNIPRTLFLEIGSGATWITSRGERTDL